MTGGTTALSAAGIEQLLRECAVVVRPGETLIIRVGEDFSPAQVREYQDSLNLWLDLNGRRFSILVVTAAELGIA